MKRTMAVLVLVLAGCAVEEKRELTIPEIRAKCVQLNAKDSIVSAGITIEMYLSAHPERRDFVRPKRFIRGMTPLEVAIVLTESQQWPMMLELISVSASGLTWFRDCHGSWSFWFDDGGLIDWTYVRPRTYR